MKPVVTALRWCDDHGENFEAELATHLNYGWVYSGEDAFVMATEECRALLEDPCSEKGVDKDTWFVYLYAGDLKRVLRLIPHNHKFVAFRRDNGDIRYFDMKLLLERIERG
jgi:hypothetical protein